MTTHQCRKETRVLRETQPTKPITKLYYSLSVDREETTTTCEIHSRHQRVHCKSSVHYDLSIIKTPTPKLVPFLSISHFFNDLQSHTNVSSDKDRIEDPEIFALVNTFEE